MPGPALFLYRKVLSKVRKLDRERADGGNSEEDLQLEQAERHYVHQGLGVAIIAFFAKRR